MAVSSRALAEQLISQGAKGQQPKAKDLARDLLGGSQAAASELLQADFEPGAYATAGLRWSLSRGDNLKEKNIRLKKKYPKGEIKILPESVVLGFDEDTLIWRESPQQQWKMVEPQGFDRMDIPEAIGGSLESIVAETAAAVKSRGLSVPVTVARQATAALFGESVEQSIQQLKGQQDQSFWQAASEAMKEFMYSAAGGFLASPLVGAINVFRGAGALKVGEEGIETIAAAKEINEEIAAKMTPALVTDNPAIRLSEAQAAALLPGLRRRYRELIKLMDDAMLAEAPGNASEASLKITESLGRFSDEFIDSLRVKGTSVRAGGKALSEGVQEYEIASRNAVNALYEVARKIEDPVFNFENLQKVIFDLRAGAKGPLDLRVNKLISQLESIRGPIELSDGNLLSITDQIRNVRTGVFALKHVEPGKVADQTTGQANDLFKAITDTLKDPQNTSKEFRVAWKAANDAASARFTTLEKAPIIAAAKSQNPADLVRSYFRPEQSDNLLAIRGAISEGKWKEFVDSALTDLVSSPEKLPNRLRSFDQETLDVLLPRREQVHWFRVAKELDRINAVGAENIAERQITNRNFIDKLIRSGDPRDAQTIARSINNSGDAATRDSARAAIIEWAWDGIMKKEKNRLVIDTQGLRKRIQMLQKSGMWSVLSTHEKRLLNNSKIVSRAFQNVMDAGTSIQAAEAVAGVRRLRAAAMWTFVQNELVSQFYLSDMGRRMLIGSGKLNTNAAIVRALSGALAQTQIPQDISNLEDQE